MPRPESGLDYRMSGLDYRTHKTVKARFRPWLCAEFARQRPGPSINLLALFSAGKNAGTKVCTRRANVAHVRQSRPDSGLGFQVKDFKVFPLRSTAARHQPPCSRRGWQERVRVPSLGFRVQGPSRVQGSWFRVGRTFVPERKNAPRPAPP